MLRGCRGATCRAAAPRRAYDLKGGSRRRHEAVLVSGMQKIVHTMRDQLGLPATFTLDACRHGGMTELEEAELTDGQGRALSAHKSQQAYAGYAKRTLKRALAATRKRHAHALTNATRTNIQNEPQNDIQNADHGKNKSASN